ncbi:MAG: hypothetical protein F6K47_33020 [Symploca sp. SIO2E6]|nr:hypothetical protein [Symploca sp. SIO2E6]
MRSHIPGRVLHRQLLVKWVSLSLNPPLRRMSILELGIGNWELGIEYGIFVGAGNGILYPIH